MSEDEDSVVSRGKGLGTIGLKTLRGRQATLQREQQSRHHEGNYRGLRVSAKHRVGSPGPLVRRVCGDCVQLRPMSADQTLSLGVTSDQADKFGDIAHARGCIKCRGTGYRGRVGVFEMFDARGPVAPLLSEPTGEHALYESARKHGMRTLRESALARLAQGLTTPEEVVRVGGL
jgi:hypothetical protein